LFIMNPAYPFYHAGRPAHKQWAGVLHLRYISIKSKLFLIRSSHWRAKIKVRHHTRTPHLAGAIPPQRS